MKVTTDIQHSKQVRLSVCRDRTDRENNKCPDASITEHFRYDLQCLDVSQLPTLMLP